MNGVTTLTQKGQVVIPQSIRRFLGLEPLDKLYFEVEEDKIIAQPILSIEEAMGMIKSQQAVSKKDYKKLIAQKVVKKFTRS